MLDTLSQADIEILEHETNYHAFLRNLKDNDIMSDCCSAELIDLGAGEYLCADCHDHCGVAEAE